MQGLKLMLVISLGLGSTWVAWQIAPADSSLMLAYAQERNGWISPENMEEIADTLDLTPAYVRSVATFYTMYAKRPVGKYWIQVCTCISCHVNQGEEVFEAFLEHTGTRAGEVSKDGKWTVIEAECLGACGFATAVQVNDRYFENVTPETVPEILSQLEKGGSEE